MNSRNKEPEARMKIRQQSFARAWQKVLQRRRQRHDPMLVLNMSIFNFADGWDRTFNPVKVHENGS
jgi:hypothetical protein